MGRLAITLLFSLILTPSALAQEDIALAKAYYKQGERLLEEGRYKEAIEAYQKGYDLSQKPAFLYNMAVVYIEMEEYGPAYRLLVEYRTKSPTSEWANIDSMLDDIRPKVRLPWVETNTAEINKAISERSVLEATQSEQAEPPQPAPLPSQSKSEAQSQPILAYGLLGLAGIGTVSGTIFTVQARSAHDSSASLCQGQLCPSEAEAFLLRENNMALAADISWVTSALGFGAGALLLSQHTSSMHWTFNHNSLRLHGQF